MRKRDDKNIECILKLEKVLTKSKVCTILVFPEYGLVLIQGCISCGMCSYSELTKDRVLTSAYVNIFRTVTRNAVNKSV